MRNVMDERIEFDPSWSLRECKSEVLCRGRNWRLGKFEWNGENFSWTPNGKEEHYPSGLTNKET